MAQDDEDKLPPLGDKTEDYLEDTRRGNSRSFLLICKGTKVKYLAVRKKPIKMTELNDARKEGYKGDGYFGVITGKAPDIVFNLARSEGYDKEPVKEKDLKAFLEEFAKFKCWPTFAIVDLPPTIPFDEKDLSNPLVARFVKLEQVAEKLIQGDPNLKSELGARVSSIRSLLLAGDFNGATPQVDQLTEAVKKAAGGAGTSQPPGSDEMETFTARLKAMKPDIDKVSAANVSVSQEVKLRTSQAAAFARSKNFGEALPILDQVEKLVKQGLKEIETSPTTPSDSGSDLSVQFNNRLRALLPQVKDAANQGGEIGLQIQALVKQAGSVAKDGSGEKSQIYAQANALLDQAESLIAKLPAAKEQTLSPDFQKSWEKAKASWLDAISTVDRQMEQLRTALLKEEDEELKKIAEFGLNAVTGDYKVPLQAAILNVDDAAGQEKARFIEPTREAVQEFRDHIETDDQVEVCDENPFDVTVTIRATLAPALGDLEQALSSAFA